MPKSKRSADKQSRKPMEFHESCGNVFKDLGYSDTEATSLLLRSELMLAVRDAIEANGWTQQETAKQFGVHQPRISDLFHGRLHKFSVETLMSWLDKLGKKVVISIENKDVA